MRVAIHREDCNLPVPQPAITNEQHLSSYSWIADWFKPTIVVPGSPPRWSFPVTRCHCICQPDTSLNIIDHNAFWHSKSPMEALFRALYEVHPTFDMRQIDIVTDDSNLCKLLNFLAYPGPPNPESSNSQLPTDILHKPFAIQAEVAGETVILSEKERKTHVVVLPGEFIGYTNQFKKAFTAKKIPKSAGHYRIVRYSLGDLKYLVRYEADAYVSSFESSNSQPPASGPTSTSSSTLEVRNQGQPVPLYSILGIRTRPNDSMLLANDIGPQLWVSRIPKFLSAEHSENGSFSVPTIHNGVEVAANWGGNQLRAKQLSVLMWKIFQEIKHIGGQFVITCYPNDLNRLVIEDEQAHTPMLPSDLYHKWDRA